jgi:hypothetical protein
VATAVDTIRDELTQAKGTIETARLHTVGAMVTLKATAHEAGFGSGLHGVAGRLFGLARQCEDMERYLGEEFRRIQSAAAIAERLTGTESPTEATELFGSIHQEAGEAEKGLQGCLNGLNRLISEVRAALDGGDPEVAVGAVTTAWSATSDAAFHALRASGLAEIEATASTKIGKK